MSLVNELRKKFQETGVRGLDTETRREQEAAAAHERRLSEMTARASDTILHHTPVFVKLVLFVVLRSVCGEGRGAFLHTLQSARGALDLEDESVYDGLDFLAGEIRVPAERLRAYGRAAGLGAKVLASLVGRAFVETVVEEYAARQSQQTVVRHALSHVHGAEAETVVDPAAKLREEMAFQGVDGWRDASDRYLLGEGGLASPDDLARHVGALRALLAELRDEVHASDHRPAPAAAPPAAASPAAPSSPAGSLLHPTPAAATRVAAPRSRPSVRAKFLQLRGQEADGPPPPAPAEGGVWPVDVHPDGGPAGDDAADELRRAVADDESHPSNTPFATWVRPKFSCHYCDDAAECGVSHEVRIGRRLGSGTSGVVFEADWDGRRCALKVFVDDLSSDLAGSDRFLDELCVSNRCHHPNTLGLVGACIRPPSYCMVMPVARHGTLYDQLHARGARLPPRQALGVALGVARGMRYLHTKLHLLHRDLKSMNVLLDGPEGGPGPGEAGAKLRPLVCDFGASVFLRPSESVGDRVVMGTPVYMAPEIRRQMPYTFSADVFSFGVLLAELATGREPYAAEIEAAGGYEPVVRRVAGKECLRPSLDGAEPALAEAVGALAAECWRDDPRARPAFSDIVPRLEAALAQL